ncbi:MAG: hypothetical protein JJD97_07320, partial [Gemmatimonadaceae bacterium]|nr:hypothetical protein [Gemmatimonadaceae bacterium]
RAAPANAAPVTRPAAPMVAQAPASEPRVAAVVADSAAPRVVSRTTANESGDTVVTTVYSVHGVAVSLIDRSRGQVEERGAAEARFGNQAMAKSRDEAAPVNSITWSDSAGRTRTLRGPVSREELERLKRTLFGATP